MGSGIVILGVLILMKVSAMRKCNRYRSSQYLVDPLFHFVKVIFGDRINKKEGSQKFIFYNYEISSLQIFMLSTNTLMVFGPTFMSFWVSFIVNETFVCDPQLDCFLHYPSTHFFPSSKRLDNCTSYDSTSGTVVCFQFVFDLTEGFSSAVGFMGVAVVYCRLYTFIMIWLQEFCSNKCQMNCAKYVSIIMQAVIGIPIITVFIIIFVRAVPFFSDVVFRTNRSTIIFYAYSFSFAYIGPLTGIYVSGLVRGARKVTSNNAQITNKGAKPLLGASGNQSNYTNLPQDT